MKLVRKLVPFGKKKLLAGMMQASGVNFALGGLPSWSGLLVVNYHRIGARESCPFDGNLYSATAERLERQVQQYQRHADVVGIDDLETIVAGRPGKHILITFDDGYRDNYDLAFPVLKQAGVPATFFIATGFIDRPHVAWWDEIAWIIRNAKVSSLAAGRWFECGLQIDSNDPRAAVGRAVQTYWQLQGPATEDFMNDLAREAGTGRCGPEQARNLWMDWDMVRELDAEGFDIGGHTVSHPVLARQETSVQREEIFGSMRRLTEELGKSPKAFSYPVGQPDMFTEETKQLVREAGYTFAFSFYGQYDPMTATDRFNIPRCAIDFDLPPAILQSRLTLPQVFARK
ncbi:polysaccharide deacetylase family protein [Rubinisphaera margarita]|uniref:polysaccharide deacetylase family protein n=1 Tax=Rubinisphaera margarita TaxID=2909586 RepID=UPI001EE7DF2B|nr:polysaccharide deacetylase family protein [Rubinisphaera margarita]MCG6155813.1 polysaccharide deacetylase family protein [Rubinisphaera margarita]